MTFCDAQALLIQPLTVAFPRRKKTYQFLEMAVESFSNPTEGVRQQMYETPSEQDFKDSMAYQSQQALDLTERSIGKANSEASMAGRTRSGAHALMIVDAVRQSVSQAADEMLAELQRFSETPDLDRASLWETAEEAVRDVLDGAMLLGQTHVATQTIGNAARTAIDEGFNGVRAEIERKLRQFKIGHWRKATDTASPSSNTINAQTIIGTIQQASPGAKASTTVSLQLSFVATAADELRRALDQNPECKEATEIRDDLATIEHQVGRETPRTGIIAEAGRSIRSITENAAGGALSPAVIAAAMALAKLAGV